MMTHEEWLMDVALGHAIDNLKHGVGFSISTRDHLMVQFSPDYRLGDGHRATRREIGPRAYAILADENSL